MSQSDETEPRDLLPPAPTSLRPRDLVAPILIAAALSAIAAAFFMLVLKIGDLPAVAHPSLILIVSAAVMVVVAFLLRSENVGAASNVTAIALALLLAMGFVLMLMALGIQLSEGNEDDARESLALLIIAPTTTLLGFVLVPAIKASRALVAGQDAVSAASTAPSQRQVGVARILGLAAALITTVGFIGILLGVLDWSRGISPTDSPYTFFAGAFAALGGALMYMLSRTMLAPVSLPDD